MELSPASWGGIEDYKEFIDEIAENAVTKVEKLNLNEKGRHSLRIVVTHRINTTNPKLRKKHPYFRLPSTKDDFV